MTHLKTTDRRRFLTQTLGFSGGVMLLGRSSAWADGLERGYGSEMDAYVDYGCPPGGLSPLELQEAVAGLGKRDRFPRTISLTFDDGPSPRYTGRILDVLAETGLKGTFFVVGKRAARWPSLIRRMVDEGHRLGNHTWSHPNLGDLSARQIHEELNQTRDAVFDALGYEVDMRLIRPPYGAPYFGPANQAWRDRRMAKVSAVLHERGELCILWQMASGDTAVGGSPAQILYKVSRQLRRSAGGVMVMHPRNGRVGPVFGRVARRIQESGFEQRSLEELLEFKYGTSIDDIIALPTAPSV